MRKWRMWWEEADCVGLVMSSIWIKVNGSHLAETFQYRVRSGEVGEIKHGKIVLMMIWESIVWHHRWHKTASCGETAFMETVQPVLSMEKRTLKCWLINWLIDVSQVLSKCGAKFHLVPCRWLQMQIDHICSFILIFSGWSECPLIWCGRLATEGSVKVCQKRPITTRLEAVRQRLYPCMYGHLRLQHPTFSGKERKNVK